MIRTPLGDALRAHREDHKDCDGLHCTAYQDIARRATAARAVWSGPTAAHTVLSVREAA